MRKERNDYAKGLAAASASIGGGGFSSFAEARIAALEKKLRELEQRETGPVATDGTHPEHPDTAKARAFEKALQDITKVAAEALMKAYL